jgi:flagellar motor switch protein FliN
MARAGQPAAPDRGEGLEDRRDWGALRDIPLRLTVEIGRTRIRVRELLGIEVGSLVVTTKLSGEPMDLSLSGEIFARAEVIIIKDKLWARLTKIVGGER